MINEKAFVKYPHRAEIRDMNGLLVDDVTDTGDTLKVSLQHLEGLTEFIKKLKAGGMCDEENLRRSMEEKYRINLSIQTLREISSMIG